MKVIELLKSKEWSGKVIDCVLRFALSFALAGAQVFGGYAPLALGMIGASGAGLRGVSALIGASAGAVLFLPFSHALRTFAAGVLIFTANNAFFDLKLYKKRAFLPLLCAGMMFSVEFVYVLRDGVGEAANCLMALLLCALGAMSGRALLSTGDKEKEDHPYAPLFILLGVLMAASSFETADGFAPGRILSMLAVLLFAFERGSAFAIPAALCIGLGMDLGAGGGSFVHAASYAFSAVLVNVTARGNRVLSALWFALSILCFALPMNAHAGLVLLYEGLAATLLFLLIPSRFLRGKRLCSDEAAQEDAAVRRKIAASAAACSARFLLLPTPCPTALPFSSTSRRKRSAAAVRCAATAGKRSISAPIPRSTTRRRRCCAAGRAGARISPRTFPSGASIFHHFSPP